MLACVNVFRKWTEAGYISVKAWMAGYCALCWVLYFSPIRWQYRGRQVVSPTEQFNNAVAISQRHEFPAHFCHNKSFVDLICNVISMCPCSRKYSSEILETQIPLAVEVSFGKGVSGPKQEPDFRCDYIVIQPGTGIFKGNVQSSGLSQSTL